MLEETGVRKKRKQVEEGREIYVANRPNDYEQIVGDRKKKQIQLQIKRNKIKELKQLEKQRERQAASLDLEMSGTSQNHALKKNQFLQEKTSI